MPATPVLWLNQLQVNTVTADDQHEPDIIQLANGNIFVAWTSNSAIAPADPGGDDIIGRIFDPLGAPVTGEFRVNQNFGGANYGGVNEFGVDLAATADGGFISVFSRAGSGYSDVLLQRYNSSGVIQFAGEIFFDYSLNSAPTATVPKVAVASASSALVVWGEGEVSGDERIMGRLYDPTMDGVGASSFTLIDFAGIDVGPDVCALENDNYVIVGGSFTLTESSISLRIIDASGGNVRSQTEIAATVGNGNVFAHSPSVVGLVGGGFAVAWVTQTLNDNDRQVNLQVFENDGSPRDSVLTIGSPGTDSLHSPRLAALADGGFTLVYDDDQGQGGALVTLHLNANGHPVGSLLGFTLGADASHPAAVGLRDGRYATTFIQQNGEIGLEILDTRDTVNAPVYTGAWQVGTVGDDVFTATGGIVHGWTGNDTIIDGGGLNFIFGDDGDDDITIDGISLDEEAHGGAGTDTLRGVNMPDGTVYDLDLGEVYFNPNSVSQPATGFENVTGTVASEKFFGTSGVNIIHGGGGDDEIDGRGGGDTLFGDDGDDTFLISTSSFAQVETFNGGAGADSLRLLASVGLKGLTLNAAASVERLESTDPRFALFGTDDDNVFDISGVTGYRTLTDNSTDPTLIILKGGADTFIGSAAVDAAYGDAGNDTLNGGGGDDYLEGGEDNDMINGGAGADRLLGGPGADTLNGDDGDDTFLIFNDDGNGDTFNGGAGTDSLHVIANVTMTSLTLNAAASVERITRSNASSTLGGTAGADVFDISGVTGYLTLDSNSTAAIAISLGAGVDTFTGSSAGDLVDGGAGNDLLNGGGGDDTLNGGADNDTINGGAGADTITGGAGADTLNGDAGDDIFRIAGAEASGDTFNGGSGIDSLRLTASVTLTSLTLNAAASVERVTRENASFTLGGTAGADNFNLGGVTGYLTLGANSTAAIAVSLGAGADTFTGASVGDLVDGGAGNDRLNGGGGDDTLNGGADDDILDGGDGIDTIRGGTGNDTINGGAGADLLFGGDGIDTIYAGAGDDYIQGDSGASSILAGEAGNDTIYGGAGDDYMIGGDGIDTMVGLGGIDSLFGGAGNDYLVAGDGAGSVVDGGAGANTLWGASGNDYIVGGEGADLLVGGAGSDYQFGNAGDDTHYGGQGTDFIFTNAGNDFVWTDDVGAPQSTDFIYVGGGTGTDTIADFAPGAGANHDVLVVSVGSGVTTFAQAQANMSQVGVYTVLTLGTDKVFIYNVQPFQMTADNFLFL